MYLDDEVVLFVFILLSNFGSYVTAEVCKLMIAFLFHQNRHSLNLDSFLIKTFGCCCPVSGQVMSYPVDLLV